VNTICTLSGISEAKGLGIFFSTNFKNFEAFYKVRGNSRK
jgi:hypothetical protein